ncbi:MAG: BamA/TamA family outer membrane protein [Bacteroidetes bacterium]|nr:BamA/TamA family outer membrane protein [Bacteroidota bacterium]
MQTSSKFPLQQSVLFLLLSIFMLSNSFADAPIYESDSLVVTDILILGTKKTKDHVILRELTFQKGSVISKQKLDTIVRINENHIFNTHLFLEVNIESRILDQNEVSFIIVVKERWYTIPNVVIELADRSLNEWWYLYNHDMKRVEYGLLLNQYNCRGRNETFSAMVKSGFSQQLYASYEVPYFAKSQKSGLLLVAQYIRNREFALTTLQSNELSYLRKDEFIRQRMRFDVRYSYRPSISNKHSINFSYNQDGISDSAAQINPSYLENGSNKQQYFALQYIFETNKTNIHYYPTAGYYSKLELVKNGLSIFNDVNHVNFSGLFSAYKPISKKLFFATQLSTEFSSGRNQSFLLAPNFGYHGIFVRSFEYYLIKGQAYFLNRNELKYHLLSHVLDLEFITLPKFNRIPIDAYVKLFFDDGYVYDDFHYKSFNLQNKWLLSAGVGLDIVSYYDMVFRFEYGWNNLKENGFFLHVNKAI